jgi:hypothetical protein
MSIKPGFLITLIGLALMSGQSAPTAERISARIFAASGEEINWQVLSGGGARGSSPGYRMNGTMGQTAAGPAASPGFRMNAGFWQAFGCCNKAGDANNDGSVNVGDAVYMINYVFKSGPPPPCLQEGNANGDGSLNVGDAVFLINYVFKAGPTPVCGP